MIFAPHLAVTDLPLEELEVFLILVLVAAAVSVTPYIRRLKSELHRQNRQLEEQSKLNAKLNSTVDRILKIEKEGGIDSNRRKKP